MGTVGTYSFQQSSIGLHVQYLLTTFVKPACQIDHAHLRT